MFFFFVEFIYEIQNVIVRQNEYLEEKMNSIKEVENGRTKNTHERLRKLVKPFICGKKLVESENYPLTKLFFYVS